MRTNKNCPKYGEDPETQGTALDQEKELPQSISQELPSQPLQKVPSKKLITKNVAKPTQSETIEGEKSSSKTKVLKVKYATSDKVPDTTVTSVPLNILEQPSTSEIEGGNRSTPKVIKIISKNVKPDEFQAESSKVNVIIRPPSEAGKEHHKKITIRQPKEVINLDHSSQDGVDIEYRKTKKMVELTAFGINRQHESNYFSEEMVRKKKKEARRMWEEEENWRMREEQARRHYEEEVRMLEEQDRVAELRKYEEDIRREREEEEWRKANKKKKKKKKTIELKDDYVDDFPPKRNNRFLPGRERSAKRKTIVDLGRFGAEYVPPTKRRRGGEVIFSTFELRSVFHFCFGGRILTQIQIWTHKNLKQISDQKLRSRFTKIDPNF